MVGVNPRPPLGFTFSQLGNLTPKVNRKRLNLVGQEK